MSGWVDPPLFFPHLEEEAALELVREHLEIVLAACERRLGVNPKTIEPFASVEPLVGPGIVHDEHPLPACQIGVFGTDREPESDRDGDLDLGWMMVVQIVVSGINASDTLARRSVYSMAVTELLLQRMPRTDRQAATVTRLKLDEIDLVSGAVDIDGASTTLGEAQITFRITVPKAIAVKAPFRLDLEPGTPGGPPTDPYSEPVPWVRIERIDSNVSKEG